jgi:hypothetical protein
MKTITNEFFKKELDSLKRRQPDTPENFIANYTVVGDIMKAQITNGLIEMLNDLAENNQHFGADGVVYIENIINKLYKMLSDLTGSAPTGMSGLITSYKQQIIIEFIQKLDYYS